MFDALEGEQYGTSFGRENGTVILNAMTVAVINENCCYRDPLGVFRTVSVEWDVSWVLEENLDDQEFCKNVVCFSLTDSLQKADYNIFRFLENCHHRGKRMTHDLHISKIVVLSF